MAIFISTVSDMVKTPPNPSATDELSETFFKGWANVAYPPEDRIDLCAAWYAGNMRSVPGLSIPPGEEKP